MNDTILGNDTKIKEFIDRLSSKSPVPGGGGASALVGAVGIALCSMVANLTLGKKKYAEFEEDIQQILSRTEDSIPKLLELIQKDAEVFEPLSAAYGIPKDDPKRGEKLEQALILACSVPMDILREVSALLDVLEQLSYKGSKLALSDVGVAASACRTAIEGAVMNVFINTKLMKNREYANKVNQEAEAMLSKGTEICSKIYLKVTEELR